MNDEPHITYFNMGPWPIYVGFTKCPEAFSKEMARLKIDDINFVNSGANATMHAFRKGGGGDLTCIITLATSGKNRACVAALIAHEAVHVAQELWDSIGEHNPGREAESYLIQMITQCCLEELWKTGSKDRCKP